MLNEGHTLSDVLIRKLCPVGGGRVADIQSMIPAVGIVGGIFDEQAGLRTLIPVLGRLQRRRPLRIVWGVTTPPPPQLELLANIEPFCMANPSDLKLLLAEVDFFVMGPPGPNSHDWILDAMACGTIVVAMQAVGLEAVCTHGMNALVVPPSDEQALEDAVTHLMENPRLRRRLLRAGFDKVST